MGKIYTLQEIILERKIIVMAKEHWISNCCFLSPKLQSHLGTEFPFPDCKRMLSNNNEYKSSSPSVTFRNFVHGS